MIELEVKDYHIDKAKKLAKEMGVLNNSITSGKGSVAGFLGEVLIADLLNAKQENTYDYDIIFGSGSTIDVKTKRTTVEPKPHYECSVAALNTTQNCDFYAFVRVKNDLSKAWFLGLIKKERYYELAKFLQKGDEDPDNNFIVKSDCYNLSIKDLWEECEKEFM